MPIVRRLAKQHGVDLSEVSGTGPSGQITRKDVMAHVADVSEATAPEPDRVRLSATRRAIASHLTRSWSEIPHVTTYDDVDTETLLEARRSLAAELGPVPLEVVAEYLQALESIDVIRIREE